MQAAMLQKGEALEVFNELDPEEYFFVTDHVNYAILRLADVVCLEATGGPYTKLTDRRGKHYVVRKTLARTSERLPRYLFFQTGRGCIVNLAHVQSMDTVDSKRFIFKLANGVKIIVSRLQSIEFRRTRQL